MNDSLKNKSIVLFDGYCNLCDATVKFILKHEKKPELFFASLHSKVGMELLSQFNIDTEKNNSIIFIQANRVYTKSSAALHISLFLKGIYPLLYGLIIIPSFIRNLVYDYVARNRYKWFGKKDNCEIMDEAIKQRFL